MLLMSVHKGGRVALIDSVLELSLARFRARPFHTVPRPHRGTTGATAPTFQTGPLVLTVKTWDVKGSLFGYP